MAAVIGVLAARLAGSDTVSDPVSDPGSDTVSDPAIRR